MGRFLRLLTAAGAATAIGVLRRPSWIDGAQAQSSAVPCCIVSRRILDEGGYEPDTSMIGYGRPARLSPTVEDEIIETVKSLIPPAFAPR